MSALPARTARRLVTPSWKDARLIVGVLLVLLAVVIGSAAFSAADDRVGMWAAKHTLTPGQPVTEEDLVRVDVQLGDSAPDYLGVEHELPDGAIMDRLLEPGELLPEAAVVDPSDTRVREVPVSVDPIYLSNLSVGSRVTVYVPRPAKGAGEPDAPVTYTPIVQGATVASLPESSRGVVGSTSGSAAVVVVPEAQVADILSYDQKDSPVKLVLESGSDRGDDA